MAAGVVLFSFSHMLLLLFFTLFLPLIAVKIEPNEQELELISRGNNFSNVDVKDVKTAECGGKLMQKVEDDLASLNFNDEVPARKCLFAQICQMRQSEAKMPKSKLWHLMAEICKHLAAGEDDYVEQKLTGDTGSRHEFLEKTWQAFDDFFEDPNVWARLDRIGEDFRRTIGQNNFLGKINVLKSLGQVAKKLNIKLEAEELNHGQQRNENAQKISAWMRQTLAEADHLLLPRVLFQRGQSLWQIVKELAMEVGMLEWKGEAEKEEKTATTAAAEKHNKHYAKQQGSWAIHRRRRRRKRLAPRDVFAIFLIFMVIKMKDIIYPMTWGFQNNDFVDFLLVIFLLSDFYLAFAHQLEHWGFM